MNSEHQSIEKSFCSIKIGENLIASRKERQITVRPCHMVKEIEKMLNLLEGTKIITKFLISLFAIDRSMVADAGESHKGFSALLTCKTCFIVNFKDSPVSSTRTSVIESYIKNEIK